MMTTQMQLDVAILCLAINREVTSVILIGMPPLALPLLQVVLMSKVDTVVMTASRVRVVSRGRRLRHPSRGRSPKEPFHLLEVSWGVQMVLGAPRGAMQVAVAPARLTRLQHGHRMTPGLLPARGKVSPGLEIKGKTKIMMHILVRKEDRMVCTSALGREQVHWSNRRGFCMCRRPYTG